MKLFVATPLGEKTITVVSSTTIESLKALIGELTNLDPSLHWLMYNDHKLNDNWMLSDYNITNNVTLEFNEIKAYRRARRSAKKSSGSDRSSSEERTSISAPPPSPVALPATFKAKPRSSWRDPLAEFEIREEQSEKSTRVYMGTLVGNYNNDIRTIMAMGFCDSLGAASILASEMACAMSGVCNDCGSSHGCAC